MRCRLPSVTATLVVGSTHSYRSILSSIVPARSFAVVSSTVPFSLVSFGSMRRTSRRGAANPVDATRSHGSDDASAATDAQPKTSMSTDSLQSSHGIFMLLSPAKTLDLSPWLAPSMDVPPLTLPSCSVTKTNAIATALKQSTKAALAKQFKLSDKLAQSTLDAWQSFATDASSVVFRKPCVYTYSGPAYQGLDVATCSTTAVQYLQDHLRILDALYGMLRPLDQIQAYRLDLTVPVSIHDTSTQLVEYWSSTVVDHFAAEVKARIDASGHEPVVVLNLASAEYRALLHSWTMPLCVRWIDVVFREGNGKVVAVHAKRARGLMARHVAVSSATSVAHVQAFDDGYRYNAAASSENRLVFDRTTGTTGTTTMATFKASASKEVPAKSKAAPKRSSGTSNTTAAKPKRSKG